MANGENPFHFSPPITGEIPFIICSYLRRGSPYTETIIRATLHMEAAGLMRGKFMPETTNVLATGSQVDAKYKSEEELETFVVVRIKTMFVFFMIYMSMSITAFIVFVFELCMPALIRLRNRRRRRRV